MKEAIKSKKLFFNRFALSIIGALFALGSISAQVKAVSGVVKDATGETIIGASVQVKGTKVASITDLNGAYKINVPADGKVLVFTYVGMDKKELPITGNTINVTLQASDKTLDEVVVIGYGTQKKRDLTGSVASVGEKQLRDIPVSSAAEALTGKLTGVQVTTTEGSPDAEIKIRVRGGGSITQSNTPLYIVDGFAKDDIKDIAPSEIEDMTVLKDASSTAIYGSRGANGVILITTKSAQLGKLSVSYNGYVGMKQVSKFLDVLTPYQFAKKQYERAVWSNKVSSDYEPYFGNFSDIDLYNYKNATNWQDETFGSTGYVTNNTVSISGGKKKFSYNGNFSHIYDKAIMYRSNYMRDNFSVKLKYTPLDWLKLDFSTRYTTTTINGSGANDQTGTEKSTSDSRVKSAVIYTPIPLKNLATQGDDTEASSELYSPLTTSDDNNRLQKNKDFNVNGGLTINLSKNLSFNSTIGLTNSEKIDKRFYGLSSYYVRLGGAKKRLPENVPAPATIIRSTNLSTLQNTNVINYKKDDIFKGHNLNVVLGQETYIKSSDYITQDLEGFTRTKMSEDVWADLSDGTNIGTFHIYNFDEKLFSYFGRVNYDMYDRYLLALTFRADGSSKFTNGNEWGYFPSVSAGWRISDEKFMVNTQSWLSNLKLRASYGEAGNNRIDDSAFKRVYSVSNSIYLNPSIYPNIYTVGDILANQNLKWETTITRNLGLDYGFFKNRLSGSIELYSNTTKDALIKMTISGVGYSSQWQNAATTSNRGAEFNLNAILVQSKDFNLNFSFNISANKNIVDKIGTLSSYTFNEGWAGSMLTASNSYVVTPGQPVGLIYGYVNDGMYSADDFTWSGSKWVMNAQKYSTAIEIGRDDNNKPIYKYSDSNGAIFADNSAIDGLSWGPGSMKLKDLNNDGKITDADRRQIGDTNPKHFGAFSFSGNYKAFDASINFNWVYGNNIYNATKIELSSSYYKFRNSLANTANSYTQIDWASGAQVTDAATLNQINANASMWSSPTGNYAVTSWAIEDGSFLRLNNLTVGYTFPAKLTKKWYVQKLRLYATGYNLFVLTKYSGYDPEVDTRRATPATPGVDYSAYPKSRSFNFGVNLTF